MHFRIQFNVRSFVFELPNDQASLIPVASCLLVKASDPEALKDPKGNPVIRPYTPVSPPDQAGELTLLIKRYEQGVMSKHVHSLKVRFTIFTWPPIHILVGGRNPCHQRAHFKVPLQTYVRPDAA